jgi:hypothetical protein
VDGARAGVRRQVSNGLRDGLARQKLLDCYCA